MCIEDYEYRSNIQDTQILEFEFNVEHFEDWEGEDLQISHLDCPGVDLEANGYSFANEVLRKTFAEGEKLNCLVYAIDIYGEFGYCRLNLTVNQWPVPIWNSDSMWLYVGQELQIDMEYVWSDSDNDSISFNYSIAPSNYWISMKDNVLKGTPEKDNTGEFVIYLTASDGWQSNNF